MTVMTELPEAAPRSGKQIQWKVLLPVVIVLILGCVCIVMAGVFMYLGTQGIGPLSSLANSPIFSSAPSVIGDWDLYYDWDCTGTYSGPAIISFYADQSYFAAEDAGGAYGTWSVQGKTIDFQYDEFPNAHYTGSLESTGIHAEGTMSTAEGSRGCWYIDKK